MNSEYVHRLGREIVQGAEIAEERGDEYYNVKLSVKDGYIIAKMLSMPFCNECKLRNICTVKDEVSKFTINGCGRGARES